jgi:chromosomal replication initiator protein
MEKGLWAAILSQLQLEISPAAFRTWFSNSQLGSVDFIDSNTNQVQIICNSNFSREQLEKRYFNLISRALNEKTGKKNILVFKVGIKDKKSEEDNIVFFDSFLQKEEKVSPFFKNFTFENLIVGNSNQLAVSSAKAVMENLGSTYNPLFFFGQSGVGKTHLLHALAQKLWAQQKDLKVVYLTGEHFTNNFIDALTSRQIKRFREELRIVDLLLVDDIQFLAAKENTQEEFFHTFNELCLSSKQIILTSDKHPTKIGGLEERLVSRFLGGLTVEIKSPDLEMKMELIEKKTRALGFMLPQAAASLIAQKTNGNVRELEGAIFKIFSSAKLLNQPPSIKIVREVFAQDETQVKIAPKFVLSTIQNYYKLKTTDLISSSRKKDVLLPRQIAMYFLRELATISLDSIGKTFGNRDHSTVIHAIEKVRFLSQKDPQIEKTLNILRAKLLN